MELAAYGAELLRDDGEFALYRARWHGDPPRILMLVARRLSAGGIRRLESEYALGGILGSGWAARPLALGSCSGLSTLVLEDDGANPLIITPGQTLPLAQALRVGIGIAAALGQVHRCGLIHKDVKPANVLVDADNRVRLTGFGIASRLPRERQEPTAPEEIAGTLAYMAPEQTGRMNRSVDTRSDLYSLGITLYEMLTGTLPFTATDPIAWVHCHIARVAVPPVELVPALPDQVSLIVMKLLSKTGEERYQTAEGLEADLRRCLAEWEAGRQIAQFPLGVHETAGRLAIPEKLYGRDREIARLLASFDRMAASGATQFVVVSGYSGVGKSAVVSEVHKSLAARQGLFGSGKFDQQKGNTPYATLAQAFRTLVRQVLAKAEAEVETWRQSLQYALGGNGQLIISLIPELELIIGEQPALAELSPLEERSRFQTVFRRFLGVFARPDQPLVIFLDDLQWVDPATLDLMGHLVTHPEVRHLLLVGAYRDNEVLPTDSLSRTLAEIRENGHQLEHIVLAQLAYSDIGQMVADSLRCEFGPAAPLAELIHQKTGGNPFFATQFLTALTGEGLLSFDHGRGGWTWDLPGIREKGFSDNVADLLALKLARLPDSTQAVLGQLACLGHVASFSTMTLVSGETEATVHATLWPAVAAGLVSHGSGTCAFVHDRVQEAAYNSIPKPKREAMHLRIGRLLTAQAEAGEDNIFEIVDQFDRGLTLIVVQSEREQVAGLNLQAAMRARASTAYAAALTYLAAGQSLLPDDRWENCRKLAFDIEFCRCQCNYFSGELAAAERDLAALAGRAETGIERGAVACLRVDVYTNLDQFDRAVAVGLDYLRSVGIDWARSADRDDVLRAYERLLHRLGSRSIDALQELPAMTDPVWIVTMDVLVAMTRPALFSNEHLLDLATVCMADLSLAHGNTDGSYVAYLFLGILLPPNLGTYEDRFRFGKVGLELAERSGSNRIIAVAALEFGNRIAPWSQPLRECRHWLQASFGAAQEAGETYCSAYSRSALITNLLASGEALATVQQEAATWFKFTQCSRVDLTRDLLAVQLKFVAGLRGLAPDRAVLDALSFCDGRPLPPSAPMPRPAVVMCSYWISQVQARFHEGDTAGAILAAAEATPLLWTLPSHLELADYHLYAALSIAARTDIVAVPQREAMLATLVGHQRLLADWAEACPQNFSSQASLIAAEIARIQGRDLDALQHYECAIRSAREFGFVQNEAVANERAAGFAASRGLHTMAAAHLGNARQCYVRWGADAKVKRIDAAHSHLAQRMPPLSPTATIGSPVAQLDVATMLKASQALSSEIVLGALIDTLMHIALEHAGADRGVLMLLRNGEPMVVAEATSLHGPVQVSLTEMTPDGCALPEPALHFVMRTRETLILDDAPASDLLSQDRDVRDRGVRSLLCVPIIKQAKLIGTLYLENKLAPRVFTSDRVGVSEFLAAQAAISLENALLYADLQRSEAFLAEGQRLARTGSWRWHLATDKVVWSEEHSRIFGFDPAAEDGPSYQTFVSRLHPDDRADVIQKMDAAIGGRIGFAFDYRIMLPDGSVKYLFGIGRPVAGEGGDVQEFVGTTMDVSDRRLAEEALRDANNDLARAARLATMGELTTVIAHEVSQPLMAIVTNADACLTWLTRSVPDLDEARQAAERIVRNGHRAGGIIKSIHAMARKSDPEAAAFDMNGAIEEILGLLQSEFRRQNITLETELDGGLDDVVADRVQLQQVILNLVMNGIEAMGEVMPGPRTLRVSSRRQAVADLLVTVADTGQGLDPIKQDRIFDAFFTTKSHGLGMGLAICRSIVEAHGGELSVSPRAPHGCIFQFMLPDVCAAKRISDAA